MCRVFTALFLLVFSLTAWSVPGTINFQGRLLDDNGIPLTTSDQAFTIRIYTADTGGLVVYSESHTEDVDDGVYSLQIGGGTGQSPAYTPTLFDTGTTLYIEIQVGSETLTPRLPLLSSPYSLESSNTQTLQGMLPSDFGSASEVALIKKGLKDVCILNYGSWSEANGCDYGSPIETVQVLPSGNSYIPIDGLFLSGPDACPEDHYHGFLMNCDSETIADPDPPGCGHGAVSAVVEIPLEMCASASQL